MADPVQLDQVFTNLLENALRFSPRGGEIAIAISPWKGAVQVRISDQGRGISPQDRERVFDAFYQGDAGGNVGSGLGLTIARAIILAHGGRIRMEGSPTGGVSVVFELPTLGGAPPVPASEGAEPAPSEAVDPAPPPKTVEPAPEPRPSVDAGRSGPERRA